MFNYIVQQEDVALLKQTTKTIYCRVELLNRDMQVVDSLEGNVKSDNFSCDGESPVRRTYNCDLVVINSTFFVGGDKKIWIDRYIKIYYGVYAVRTREIKWYTLGVFTFVDMNYTYSSTDATLSLTCMDRMAEFDGTKGGVMTYGSNAETRVKIYQGQDYAEVIEGLVNDAGITHYSITGVDGYTVPYDLEFQYGTTYCEVWTQLQELYNYWEFFFDEEGNFIWRKLPTGYGQDVVLDDNVLDSLVVSETLNDTFQNVYNVTEIWGRELDIVDDDRYALTCSGGTSEQDNVFNITLDGITAMSEIDNFTNFAIKVSGTMGKYISINGIETIPIFNYEGTELADNVYVVDQTYVFRYRRTATGSLDGIALKNFYLLGQFQAHGYYEETSENTPYSIPNVGHRIVKVIENTELHCDEVCQSQAEYETYQTTAKQDSITLETIIIPFLEPSQKIKYSPKSSETTDEWMISSLSWSTQSGTMQIEAYRFLEDYSYVVDRTNT